MFVPARGSFGSSLVHAAVALFRYPVVLFTIMAVGLALCGIPWLLRYVRKGER